jgi:hypothetical protein
MFNFCTNPTFDKNVQLLYGVSRMQNETITAWELFHPNRFGGDN